MKIVSYNINQYSLQKLEHVLSMGADLYVLPECANRSQVDLPNSFEMLWTGDDDLPYKGLAVIWKRFLRVEVPTSYRKIKHILPIVVEEDGSRKFILASWPTVWKEKKTYPQLLLEALDAYEEFFTKYPSLVIGDFNCYVGQSGVNRKTGTFEDCIKKLNDAGLYSLYHKATGEEFGKETTPTFYWRFKEASGYHIDYAFTNTEAHDFHIGEWESEISDHRPLSLEF